MILNTHMCVCVSEYDPSVNVRCFLLHGAWIGAIEVRISASFVMHSSHSHKNIYLRRNKYETSINFNPKNICRVFFSVFWIFWEKNCQIIFKYRWGWGWGGGVKKHPNPLAVASLRDPTPGGKSKMIFQSSSSADLVLLSFSNNCTDIVQPRMRRREEPD